MLQVLVTNDITSGTAGIIPFGTYTAKAGTTEMILQQDLVIQLLSLVVLHLLLLKKISAVALLQMLV